MPSQVRRRETSDSDNWSEMEDAALTLSASIVDTCRQPSNELDGPGNKPHVVSRHAGVVKPRRYLDMPPLHHKTFGKHAEFRRRRPPSLMRPQSLPLCCDLDYTLGDDDIVDQSVSFDGSWMTRGHKSLYRIGCVVDVMTGLVIDLAVLALYC